MDYKTSQRKSEFFIGNGTLWLTKDALKKIASVIDDESGDVFEYISEAVNHYAADAGVGRLCNIERMLQSLLDDKAALPSSSIGRQEIPTEPEAPKPKVKIAMGGGGRVDIMKALQNMKKMT